MFLAAIIRKQLGNTKIKNEYLLLPIPAKLFSANRKPWRNSMKKSWKIYPATPAFHIYDVHESTLPDNFNQRIVRNIFLLTSSSSASKYAPLES